MNILTLTTHLGVGELVARGTLLLLVGWCGALVMRRAPARARHVVWLSAIVGLLLIPGVARVASVRVALLPHRPAPSIQAPSVDQLGGFAAPLAKAVQPVGDSGVPTAPRWRASYTSLCFALWLGVALALLGRLALGRRAVRRLLHRSRPLDSSDWHRALGDAAQQLHISNVPPLVVSDQVDVAFACDAIVPTIVLPAGAAEWPDDQKRAVLLHELAHIRRRDLLSHAAGRIACAVYWFHPLVWIAARRLRAESEQACDELVLDSGVRASDYAQHLLDMVMALSPRHAAPAAALPMVRPKEFEGRLVAILDRGSRRRPVGRAQFAALIGLFGLLTISIAAVVPVPRRTTAMLSDATVASLVRYGTTGMANPMLMILGQSDSLGLTARQADSIATLSRWYMVRLSGIWSPAAKFYSVPANRGDRSAAARFADAPLATANLLIGLAPQISGLLTPEQRAKLSPRIAAYLDPTKVSAVANALEDPNALFVSNRGAGGRGGRGRVGGGGL